MIQGGTVQYLEMIFCLYVTSLVFVKILRCPIFDEIFVQNSLSGRGKIIRKFFMTFAIRGGGGVASAIRISSFSFD